ncbi:MAG: aminoacyl--tRNA ligase-related protein [Minisyncoccia bacterium]|jgi:prolyl-tRNA synthetase
MRLSQLFTRTLRENPKDETSANAQLLERGGFVYKNSAGIYSYLPLGWRVFQKIAGIIREEMNAIGGMEMLMQAMVEKKYLDATGRWDVPIGFEVKGKNEDKANFTLGWTHEEVLTEIASKYVNSYKDLPFYAYQIQTKFRNEPRAKSGILRGKEFTMKDLYSFHVSEDDLFRYYEEVKGAYHKIFNRCGLKAFYTIAGGGDFTISNTHEFQVLSPVGEDTIFICQKCGYAENKDISKLKTGVGCPKCDGKIVEEKAIEVGNIFPLGTKYSKAFNLQFVDEKGEKKFVVMGSYGIGIGRVMGAVVEVHHDGAGIIWPENVAPFKIHLIALEGGEKEADRIYKQLSEEGIEVLYDDRTEKTAGEKFADADLIGCPIRILVSKKTLANNSFELKKRSVDKSELINLSKLMEVVG